MPAICPVAAVQQYFEAVRTCNWEMGRGYLFPVIDVDGSTEAAKREVSMTPELMTAWLKFYAGRAGVADKGHTMHSFRVGTAVSQALQGRSIINIIQCVFLKSERVARRYTGIGVTPGPESAHPSQGISHVAYDWVDKFPATVAFATHALLPRTPLPRTTFVSNNKSNRFRGKGRSAT